MRSNGLFLARTSKGGTPPAPPWKGGRGARAGQTARREHPLRGARVGDRDCAAGTTPPPCGWAIADCAAEQPARAAIADCAAGTTFVAGGRSQTARREQPWRGRRSQTARREPPMRRCAAGDRRLRGGNNLCAGARAGDRRLRGVDNRAPVSGGLFRGPHPQGGNSGSKRT